MTTIDLQQFAEEKKQRTTRLIGAPSEWERLQRHTFKNWLNAVLAPRNQSVQILEEDLSDGKLLISVMELLYDTQGVHGEQRRRYLTTQQDSSHLRIDAVHSVFKFMRTHLKMTVTLAPEAIVQGESKTIMRLIWELIQKREIIDRKLTRNLLLQWARDRAASTDASVEVKNLSNSFQDPRVWAAIINSFRAGLYDASQISQKSSAEALRELFELAEKELHVPQLLDVALVDVSSDWPPDERSILTYLAMYLKLDEKYPQQTLRELQQQGRVSRVGSGTTINGTAAANVSESVKQSPLVMVRVLSNKRLQMKRENSGAKISPANSPRASVQTEQKDEIPPPPPAPMVIAAVELVDQSAASEPITEPHPTAAEEPQIDQSEPELKIEPAASTEQVTQPAPLETSEPVLDAALVDDHVTADHTAALNEPRPAHSATDLADTPAVEVTPPAHEDHVPVETDQSAASSTSQQMLLAPIDLTQHQDLRRDSTTETEESTQQSHSSYDERSADSALNKEIVSSPPMSTDSENLTSETRSSEATEQTATENKSIKLSGSLNDTNLRRSGSSSKDASPSEKDKHKKGKRRRENLRTSQTSASIEPLSVTDRRLAASQSDPVLPPMSEDSHDEEEHNSSSKSSKKFLGKIKKAFKQAMDDMHVTRHHDEDDKDDKKRPETTRPKSMREVSTAEKKRSPLAAFVDLFKPSSRKEKTRSMSLEKEQKTKKRIQHKSSMLNISSPEVQLVKEDVQRSRSTSVAPEDLKESRARHQSLPASAMSRSSPVAASAKKGPVIKPMKDIKRPLDFGLTRFNGVQNTVLLDSDAVRAYNEHIQNNTNQLLKSSSSHNTLSHSFQLSPELVEHYTKNVKRVTLLQSLIKTRAARVRLEQLLKRSIIAREILKSESSYVDSLTNIIKLFKQPLTQFAANNSEKSRAIQFNAADIKVIFSEIDVILNYNQMMQMQLTERVSKWNADQRLGDIFLGMTEFMKVYTQYVKNFNDALKTLSVYRQNKLFRDWLQEVRNNPESSNLTINDFLIMPVQRIPRYVMLLEDLLQTTPRLHKDYRDVKLAAEKMGQICQYVNEKKRDAENLDQVLQVQDRLRFKDKRGDPNGLKARNLSEAHRRYIKEGYLTVYRNTDAPDVGNSKRRYYIVFNDLVLETKLNMKKKRKKSIAPPPGETDAPVDGSEHPLVNNRISTDKLYFIKEIVISFDSVIMESKAVPFGFSLKTKDAQNLFSAASKEEQEEWITLIKRNLAQLIKNKLSQELELMKKV